MEPALSGCFICYNYYDHEAHLPRILPLCGHTVCECCLKSLFNDIIPKCPFDKVVFRTTDINSFPQNFALKEMLQQKTKFEFCPSHGDKIRFACITCKKRICSYCAFVEHKEHVVKPIEEMEAEVEKRKQQLKTFVETLDKEKSKATNRIEELRMALETEVNTCFESMLNSLFEKKSKVEELINRIFLEEKDKFKGKLYVYEIEKIRVLNALQGPQDFYNVSETNAPDTSKFLADLSEAETTFESSFLPQMGLISENVKDLYTKVQENVSKLEVPNPSPEKNHYQLLEAPVDNSADFEFGPEWYGEEEPLPHNPEQQHNEEIQHMPNQMIIINENETL